MMTPPAETHTERYFSPDPAVRDVARTLYASIAALPLVCPHGHVDPRVFADPDYHFGTPADLFIIPDHYVVRMLYSQGVPMEDLLPTAEEEAHLSAEDKARRHRAIWQIFAERFHLFRGTPTGLWIRDELRDIFGIHEKLTGANAQDIYDRIADQLAQPGFRPRALYARFNIEVLCTTDAATDSLEHHQRIRQSGWGGRILPTFRPDGVINIDAPDWRANIERLAEASGISITHYASFLAAIEQRRAYFKAMGAVATDHAALTPFTVLLSAREADAIFQRALRGETMPDDASRFTGHMLMQMARMSVEDGLVMQLHVGALRNHNRVVFERFGPDKGADIPVATEYTRNLQPLLNAFGDDRRFRLILFTLDEATYARELAPLAGHYPAVRLGPPWWFHDSLNGMRRFFNQVMETAGIYNTAGFNDDTRAFCSIPARHDLWRRAACDWLAGLVVRHVIDEQDAHEMARALAYDLTKITYHL
ncbi:MAG: glucuronate isomerase [Chloroflexi bacterium]|uniref:Uronate isomerase n=2 Tax=Candidatus Thermofonsia Clade 3 TaxID=2364209 RepID=A0A2M8QFN0_9CHLR|nr:glucuronate isomerase [Candidatus Roseilinea sp. NK_OTU-006]PJF48625.1 MAG: glucuronate isomerase [Candidatus Thermofonsia Clade 3 bacterium]RMG62436.1 MAG: glucuronate isomerase [Chloroflexota bacterium]